MSFIRRTAATSALALAASGLGVVAAQPATAADDGTLTWSFSDYLFNPTKQPVGFTGHQTAGGAATTDAGIVFGGGNGTGSLEAGDLDVAYTGSVTFSWHVDLTFSDPEVVVEGDEGRIVADVAWKLPETGAADDVVLTTFDPASATVDGSSFTATPDWSAGSWSPEFLAAVPSSIHGYFKASGSASDARKAPSAFTASTAPAAVAPSVTATPSYAGSSVSIAIEGRDFPESYDPTQGVDGVYATLAPAGEFPDTDSFEDQDDVPATDWIPASRMQDGAFTVTLFPANGRLDPRKSYSIYTHQAHRHASTALDTETPVSIDFSKLGKATKLTATKKGKQLVVTVGKRAAGKVAVKFTKGKATKKASAQVKPKTGKATVKLPAARGTWKAVVSFKPSKANYRAAGKTFTVKR